MDQYFDLINAADRTRVMAGRPRKAMRLYKQAIQQGGPRNTYCHQMIGVCYKMLRNNEAALRWCRLAADNSVKHPDQNDGFLPGSLYRDMGDIASSEGDYEDAADFLAQSLVSILQEQTRASAEYGITSSFFGRHHLRQGDRHQALLYFREADKILSRANNRDYELYNKLDLINALHREGFREEAEMRLREAYLLTRDFGSWRHKIRLYFLRFGGAAIDTWARP